MPNGRTLGFSVTRTELVKFLENHEDDEVVGKDTSVAQMREMVDELSDESVFVEEQDGSWYIMHLAKWVMCDSSSPLYKLAGESLRKRAEEHQEERLRRRPQPPQKHRRATGPVVASVVLAIAVILAVVMIFGR